MSLSLLGGKGDCKAPLFFSLNFSLKEVFFTIFVGVIVTTLFHLISISMSHSFFIFHVSWYSVHQSQYSYFHLNLHIIIVSDLIWIRCVFFSEWKIWWPVLLTLASLVLLLVLYYGVECVSDDACFLFGLCLQNSISGSCLPEQKSNINANLVAINAF